MIEYFENDKIRNGKRGKGRERHGKPEKTTIE